ncbi:UDP-N-acetylglucosamine 2-epimerase [Legionella tunisiensis]|uniref:UDP-N-acetylglucosamine 2-epimerase n=1 Tax=Legionella tunisiensis TaxID=1034944 RepID=UPI0002D9FB49|nr:UDP-N-acetylglucosamine 2-epimerase [Legionella tunisiensis]
MQIHLHSPYFLVTYHPATNADEPVEATFAALLQVLDDWPEHQVLFTYPNADNGGHIIIQLLENYCKTNPGRAFAVKSLGFKKYLSAVAHAEAVIGNSSSGIIEVPAFGVPTVNIGLRQEGRLAADSILHCKATYPAIKEALSKALNPAFREKCRQVNNPYGNGQVSARILPVLKEHELSTVKHFQDWNFQYV